MFARAWVCRCLHIVQVLSVLCTGHLVLNPASAVPRPFHPTQKNDACVQLILTCACFHLRFVIEVKGERPVYLYMRVHHWNPFGSSRCWCPYFSLFGFQHLPLASPFVWMSGVYSWTRGCLCILFAFTIIYHRTRIHRSVCTRVGMQMYAYCTGLVCAVRWTLGPEG